jgi:hypothetical protein
VLIDGTHCRKVSNESKWVSTRYAMVRRAEELQAIRLMKCSTELNFSDILTKALTGASFFRHRAAILGLAAATSDVGDSAASSSSAPLGVARAPTAEQSGPIRPHA